MLTFAQPWRSGALGARARHCHGQPGARSTTIYATAAPLAPGRKTGGGSVACSCTCPAAAWRPAGARSPAMARLPSRPVVAQQHVGVSLRVGEGWQRRRRRAASSWSSLLALSLAPSSREAPPSSSRAPASRCHSDPRKYLNFPIWHRGFLQRERVFMLFCQSLDTVTVLNGRQCHLRKEIST